MTYLKLIQGGKPEPVKSNQIDEEIMLAVTAKYRHEEHLKEPHVYKFMGCVVTGITKQAAINKLQAAIGKLS